MAAPGPSTSAPAPRSRIYQKLQTIQFYLEKHRVNPHQIISKRNRCQTKEAMKLRIGNIVQKSKQEKVYYLGSTYMGEEEHLWMYMRIAYTKGEGSILNIYTIHKKVEELNICITFRDTVTYSFESALPGENYHLMAIKLTEDDLKVVRDNPIFIPISIEVSDTSEEEPHAWIREVVDTLRREREDRLTPPPINGISSHKPRDE